MQRPVTSDLLISEITFSTSRSSGPGGQNVNKVNSKVTLKFDLENSAILTQEEKDLLRRKLATRLTTGGVLLLSSQEKRSQLQNKEEVLEKLSKLLSKAFEKKKVRKPTKPSKSAVKKRVEGKKRNSEKKQWRQKPL
jgi:ribosome-associated protein